MFFSVIVPIYNACSYIRRGVECLMSQNFRDFEIIMVNDSSTDGSGTLCDEMKLLYANIKVIHQSNTGPGGARNAGIDVASGKYLAFFDIDDLVPANWLEKIHDYIEKYDSQLLIYGYREINTRYDTRMAYSFDFAQYNSNSEFKSRYVDTVSGLKFNNGFVWNKVYEHKFIMDNHIRFENLRIQEDEVFNLLIYPLVERVVVLPDVLYEYYVYYKGNTTSGYIQNRLGNYRRVRDAFVGMYDVWGMEDNRFLAYVHKRFYDSVLCYINSNLYHPAYKMASNERKKELERIFNAEDLRHSLKCMKELGSIPKGWLNKMCFNAVISTNISWYQRIHFIDMLNSNLKYRIKSLLMKFNLAIGYNYE